MSDDLPALLDECEPSSDAGPNVLIRTDAGRVLIAELRRHQAAVQAVRELADWLDSLHDPSYRFADAADRIRAAVAALDPKEQTDE